MKLSEQNIMFFTRSMELGGTENVILQLCEILNNEVNKIVVCSGGGVNVQKLEKMGIRHYKIDDIENKSIKTMISVFKTLSEIIKTEKINIIHTHHRMAAFYTRILIKNKKVRFINTSHNIFYNKKYLTKYAYSKANLVACGNMVKRNLSEYFGLENKDIHVINNAVKEFDNNIVKIPILEELKEKGYYLVGNIGRLSKQKGIEYFIKSIPKIKNSCPMSKYIIVGDGEDKVKLQQLVDELNINEDVIFMGYRSDIQNIISQLDIIVLSSLWEGLPLIPIEAFSVGKSIIATNIEGTSEIVIDNYNGILVPSKNYEMISNKVIELIFDKDKLEELNKNARKFYENNLNYKKFSDAYKNYYINLLEK